MGAMRSTFRRIGDVAVILATIGSFLIGLREAVYFTGQDSSNPRPDLGMPSCNWKPYAERLRRLRGIPKTLRPSGWEKLGEDTHFAYYYDHETEKGLCEWLINRSGSRIDASRSRAPSDTGQTVILVCVLVIIMCGISLMIIRAKRNDKQ
jgi:hypothetical protein